MNFAKIKIFASVLLFTLSAIMTVLPAPEKSYAAPSFIDAKGQADSYGLQFLSPFEVVDKNTNDSATPDGHTHYITTSTPCNNERFFACGEDYADTFDGIDKSGVINSKDNGQAYWYWPSSDGKAVLTPVGGKCVSAIVLSIAFNDNTADAVSGATVSIVTPQVNSNSQCEVRNTGNALIDTSDLEGKGVDASGLWEATQTVGDTYIAKRRLISGDGTAADKKMLLGVGTMFHWVDATHLQSYFDDSRKPAKITNAPAIKNIVAGLKKGANNTVKGYADNSAYSYYSTSSCYNKDKGSWMALIVVKNGDNSQGQILHRVEGDADRGFNNDWNNGSNGGDNSPGIPSIATRCLYAGTNVARTLPSQVWQRWNKDGDPHHNQSDVIGLADVIKVTDPDATVGGSVDTDAGSATEPNIHCNVSWNPLTWFLCPLANIFIGLAHSFENLIDSYLCVSTDTSDTGSGTGGNSCSGDGSEDFGGNSLAAYHGAWAAMRALALGIIVIIGLIAIFSQATGVEIFDAYTIKKTMPRLMFAAIAIALSWPVLNWFVGLTNDLGFGVRSLIYSATSGNFGGGNFDLSGNISGFFGNGVIVAMGIGGLLAFGATAALFGAVAFLIIVVRQIAIVALVIFAPIALVLYAAPMGQKLFGRWWQEFAKMTLAFPLISAAIAIGHVFGAIGLSNPDSGASQIIGFTGYLAGDAAVVAILLKSGQLLSMAGGRIQGASRIGQGFVDRRRKSYNEKRGKKWAGRVQQAKQGNLNANFIPQRFSRTHGFAQNIADGANFIGKRSSVGLMGAYGIGAGGGKALEAHHQHAVAEASKEHGIQAVAAENATNRLLLWGHEYGEARATKMLQAYYEGGGDSGEKMSEADAAAKVAGAKQNVHRVVGGYNASRAGAAFLNMGRDGTAIRDHKDMAELAQIAGEGSGSNAYLFASQVASVSRQVGRHDLAIATEPLTNLISSANAVHTELHGKPEGSIASYKAVANYDVAQQKAAQSGGGGETAWTKLSNAKSRAIKNDVENSMSQIDRYLKDPSSMSQDEAAQAAAIVMDYQAAVSSGQGKVDNRQAFIDEMNPERQAQLDKFLEQKSVRVAEVKDADGNVTGKAPVPRMGEKDVKLQSTDASGRVVEQLVKTQEQMTARDYVTQIVGSRYADMTPEQREMQARFGQRPTEASDAQNDQNQQGS